MLNRKAIGCRNRNGRMEQTEMNINRETTETVFASDSWQLLQAGHSTSVADALDQLGSSESGISQEEASSRLNSFGPNQLPERNRTSAWIRLLQQFHNPLIYVLLATAAATAFLGHWVDTAVIVGVVVINAIIGFVQEAKAEQAIESLKEMLAPLAFVIRAGAKIHVPAVELVPGDLVLLEGGDKVPADLRLTRVSNLQIDEAPLTGESLPVAKTVSTLHGNVPLGDRKNMAFAGTLTTSGTATGIVVATASDTEIGRIAGMLHEVEGVTTPLIRRLARFSAVITQFIIVCCVVVFLAGVLVGRHIPELLMAVVALAVSAIPEGLPAIMTIALAIGVKRMATRNTVVRKLPAVETLGSATVICTDKTGTLTRNEMTVTRIISIDGVYEVTGSGYDPSGTILNGNTPVTAPEDSPALYELANAVTLCNDSLWQKRNGQWGIDGDPTEGALLVMAGKLGLDRETMSSEWPRTDEIPFTSESQSMATLHCTSAGHARIYMKGSPEAVLDRCSHEWSVERPLKVSSWQHSADDMAAQGLRVLAVAEKTLTPQQTVLAPTDAERDFAFLGLIGMTDPPRLEVIDAVEKCYAAGIRVKMITGDHIATAQAVGQQIRLQAAEGAMTGVELQQLDDSSLDRAVDTVDVFARVAPAQKLRIVQSLQRRGHVVAMTGDGVNDAPALKQADIGVAMGITGTDVAKEAAEMVLLDDNFASIERAIEEGRTVFNNLKKTIVFILPTNGGECLTLVAALLLGTLLPILPLHVLWINLVTTVALAITLAFDPVEEDIMRQPPNDPDLPLIDASLVWRTVYVSVLISLGTFGLFFYELDSGNSLEVARAVAVNTIVFFEVAYVLNSRHLSDSVLHRRRIFGNPIVWWGIGAVVVFQTAFTYLPIMNSMFSIAPLNARMWLRVLGLSLFLMLLVECEKAVGRRFSLHGQSTDTCHGVSDE